MELLSLILVVLLSLFAIVISAYLLFYLFAVLSSPVYIAYKAFYTTGDEKQKYIQSAKGMALLIFMSLVFYFIVK